MVTNVEVCWCVLVLVVVVVVMVVVIMVVFSDICGDCILVVILLWSTRVVVEKMWVVGGFMGVEV